MKKILFAVLAGVVAMGAAQAQPVGSTAPYASDAPHAYIGIGTGAVRDSITDDLKRTTKIFGGYEFDRNWGIEAGYARLGKSGFYEPLGASDYAYTHVKSSSMYMAAKYSWQLGERSSVYGKLGLAHTEQKYTSRAPGWNFKENQNGVYAAVGLQYKLTDRLSMFAEYERNGKRPLNGPKNNVLGVGLKYGF